VQYFALLKFETIEMLHANCVFAVALICRRRSHRQRTEQTCGGIIYYLLLLLLLDEFNNVRFANRGHIRAKRAHSISAPRADEMCCCAAAAGTLLWQAAGRERGKDRETCALLCH